jgi:hypothetical protein
MPIENEKMPWESYTEMVAFVGLVFGLLSSFGLIPGIVVTPQQIGGIASILFLGVMIARKYGSGGKIVFKKAPVEAVEEPKVP